MRPRAPPRLVRGQGVLHEPLDAVAARRPVAAELASDVAFRTPDAAVLAAVPLFAGAPFLPPIVGVDAALRDLGRGGSDRPRATDVVLFATICPPVVRPGVHLIGMHGRAIILLVRPRRRWACVVHRATGAHQALLMHKMHAHLARILHLGKQVLPRPFHAAAASRRDVVDLAHCVASRAAYGFFPAAPLSLLAGPGLDVSHVFFAIIQDRGAGLRGRSTGCRRRGQRRAALLVVLAAPLLLLRVPI
mmetsp:Transcript_98265/g.282566  ORF Transcript_98265/g.282566 Transcript_98265/m.282566 type:complete len:247 (-) Transcript_98265:112-852(-)